MAIDEGLVEIMRQDLGDQDGLTERKMFGGLCFMLNGHMVCGIHKDGAMFRVGKDAESTARALPGTGPMDFTGRPMSGFVHAYEDAWSDDENRMALINLSLAYVKSLPPK